MDELFGLVKPTGRRRTRTLRKGNAVERSSIGVQRQGGNGWRHGGNPGRDRSPLVPTLAKLAINQTGQGDPRYEAKHRHSHVVETGGGLGATTP